MQAKSFVCILAGALQLFCAVVAEAQTTVNPAQPQTSGQRLIGKWQIKQNNAPENPYAHMICSVYVLEFGANGKLDILDYDFKNISKCPSEPGPCWALNAPGLSEHPGRYRVLGKDSLLLEIYKSSKDTTPLARRVYKMKWTGSSMLLRYDEKRYDGPNHTIVDWFNGEELYKYKGRYPAPPDCRP